MPRKDVVVIDGVPHSWRALCELRKAQRAASIAARGTQETLFELKDDSRPAAARSASGRYEEPGLFD